MKKTITTIAFGLLGLSLSAQVPSYVPTNGLQGWWPFSGNANDYSSNTNNGTVTGSTLVADRFGNTNSAYSFNGVNNYISIGNVTLQSFSFSSWIYNTSVNQSNLNGIISNLNSTPYKGIELRVQPDSTLMLVCGIGSNWLQPTTSFKLSNNTWYHIVATSDNSTIKIYVNAQQIASYGISNFINNTINPNILFGTRDPSISNGGWYTGKLDDIGVWNRALDSTEVSNLYNGNICYQNITVTDTLLINTTITGFNPVTYNNTIKVWPNPTNDHITIDNGNLANVTVYQIKITNSLGQQVFQSALTQHQFYVDLSTWTGNGIYFVHIIDAQGNTIDIKKIVLQ